MSPPDAGQETSPEELRQSIEETRRDLGDTVEALAEKTDVKGQVKDRVEEGKESIRRRPQFAAGAIAALILLLLLHRRRR